MSAGAEIGVEVAGDGRPGLLTAVDIRVSLGGRQVVSGVSLSLGAGEVVGIFGPSGAGKSTLFRALAGEERLAAGRVLLGAEDVTRLPLWQRARRGLGYVPQTPSVLYDLTVAENMAVFLEMGARRPGEAPASDPVTDLGLGERRGVRASALSGGERRRLELARALALQPRVLLLDEPFAAIDPLGAGRVAEQIRGAASRGAAVLVADHHVAELLRLCDRAALLLEGETVIFASPEAFRASEIVQKHYFVA